MDIAGSTTRPHGSGPIRFSSSVDQACASQSLMLPASPTGWPCRTQSARISAEFKVDRRLRFRRRRRTIGPRIVALLPCPSCQEPSLDAAEPEPSLAHSGPRAGGGGTAPPDGQLLAGGWAAEDNGDSSPESAAVAGAQPAGLARPPRSSPDGGLPGRPPCPAGARWFAPAAGSEANPGSQQRLGPSCLHSLPPALLGRGSGPDLHRQPVVLPSSGRALPGSGLLIIR